MFEAVSGPVWTCVWTCLYQVQTCSYYREVYYAPGDSNPGCPTHHPTMSPPARMISYPAAPTQLTVQFSVWTRSRHVWTCLDLVFTTPLNDLKKSTRLSSSRVDHPKKSKTNLTISIVFRVKCWFPTRSGCREIVN